MSSVETVKFSKYDPASGRILFVGEVPKSMLELQGDHVVVGAADPRIHYVDLGTGQVRAYTDEEQQAKDALPVGWIWKLPERVAMDLRSTEQREKDALQAVLVSRARAYPPMSDFADALYWQSKGDDSKWTAYVLACDQVKQNFPKPT